MKLGIAKNDIVFEEQDLKNIKSSSDLINMLVNMCDFIIKLINYIKNRSDLTHDDKEAINTLCHNLEMMFADTAYYR